MQFHLFWNSSPTNFALNNINLRSNSWYNGSITPKIIGVDSNLVYHVCDRLKFYSKTKTLPDHYELLFSHFHDIISFKFPASNAIIITAKGLDPLCILTWPLGTLVLQQCKTQIAPLINVIKCLLYTIRICEMEKNYANFTACKLLNADNRIHIIYNKSH